MHGTAAQFLRYAIVGTLSFCVDESVLMVLTQAAGIDAVIAAPFSFTASIVFNYFVSMRYVFVRRDDLSRRREFTLFCVLSAVGLVINEVCVALGVALFGEEALTLSIIKVVTTMGPVTIWNFLSRKHWLDAGDK